MQFFFNQKLNSKYLFLIFFKNQCICFWKSKPNAVLFSQNRCAALRRDVTSWIIFFEKKYEGRVCFWKSNSNAFLFSKNRCSALHLSLRCIYLFAVAWLGGLSLCKKKRWGVLQLLRRHHLPLISILGKQSGFKASSKSQLSAAAGCLSHN